MSHFGILLVGLVVLGGLLLSLASLIVLIFCWKRRTLRWVFAGGLVLGLLPMVAYMTANSNYDPNDNEMAQAWCGSYSLSCSPYVGLIINADSRFQMNTSESTVPLSGDWEQVYDDEYFIDLNGDNGQRLRIQGTPPNVALWLFKDERIFTTFRCEMVCR